MTISFSQLRGVAGRILCGLLISILAFSVLSLRPQHVSAQLESVTVVGGPGSAADIKTSIDSTISAAADLAQAAVANSLFIKEWTLDGIAFGLAKTVLKQMTSSIVSWINSGFEGSPAFVQDLESYLINSADAVAGEFIYGSELGFLCSPFELNIRLALALQQYAEVEDEVRCTLSGVVDNVEGFFYGTFEQGGGWPAWFEVVTNTQNTPLGALAIASSELELRTARDRQENLERVGWGRGFLSWTECTPVGAESSAEADFDAAQGRFGGQQAHEACSTVTPGSVIQEQLTFELQSGELALIEADEINEILTALFSQLAQTAITGAAGLLGLSQDYDGGGAYLDRLALEGLENSVPGSTDAAFIANSLSVEQDYAILQEEIVLLIDEHEAFLLNAAASCSAISGALSQTFVRARQDALDAIAASEDAQLTLQDLIVRYDSTTDDEVRFDIYLEYQDLELDQLLHTEIDIVQTEFDVDELADDLTEDRRRVQQQLFQCSLNDGSNEDRGNQA